MMAGVLGFVTPDELAELLALTPEAIRYHCKHGSLRGRASKLGGRWFIPTADADAFAARYRAENAGAPTP